MGDVVELRPDQDTIVQVADRPLHEAKARLVQTIDDAWDLLRWLGERGPAEEIALDTETTGLSRQRDHVRLVQIGDEMMGWAIPFERWSGVVEDIVRRYQGWYVLHNAPFDWPMLADEGIQLPSGRVHDTRVMAHVLSSTGPLGLKPLSQREVDPAAAAAEQALKTGIGAHGGWTWENVPITYEPYWVYGALDTVLTKRLKNKLWPRVQADALRSYQLEMAVLWVCARMERVGAKVDREYTRTLRDKLSIYVEQTEQWCQQYYGVSAGSDKIAIILQQMGIQLTKRTPGGKFSLDKEVLGGIEHPLAEAVLGRRRAQKLVSTYLDTYLLDSELDGRIHPNINTIGGMDKNAFESGGSRGVRTGRMSMDSPNLQNVPVHTDVGKKIRNCFDVDTGNVWIKCDADQIEMRILAHLSDDPGLIAAFKQAREGGPDMFTQATRDIFADPTIDKSDLRRQYVKNGFYAINYGAGLEQFAKTAKIFHPGTRQPDLGAANAFLQSLHARYPGIHRLQRQTEAEAFATKQATGTAYVRSFLTNRKHTADDGREYALLNYMIQGAAGEILKMKIIQADYAGLGPYMLFPVHDEIDFEVPEDELPDVLHTLDEVMNDDELLDVPITWTSEHGPRWGECS